MIRANLILQVDAPKAVPAIATRAALINPRLVNVALVSSYRRLPFRLLLARPSLHSLRIFQDPPALSRRCRCTSHGMFENCTIVTAALPIEIGASSFRPLCTATMKFAKWTFVIESAPIISPDGARA